jgi:hypothetical protein
MEKHPKFSLWFALFAVWGVFLLNAPIVSAYGPRGPA